MIMGNSHNETAHDVVRANTPIDDFTTIHHGAAAKETTTKQQQRKFVRTNLEALLLSQHETPFS